MFEDILSRIATFPPFWIYISLLLFAFVENIFPPSPSDIVIVIGGTLVGTGDLNFFISLIFATIGSITGFMLMFYIGSTVDKKVIHSGKFKYIPVNSINKVEVWFRKYGYLIVVANRFMPGTRAVISFFAGISNLKAEKTFLLCFVSALTWNLIMLYLGFLFGNNVDMVDKYLTTYSNIVIVTTIIVIVFIVLRLFFRKRKTSA